MPVHALWLPGHAMLLESMTSPYEGECNSDIATCMPGPVCRCETCLMCMHVCADAGKLCCTGEG